MFLKNVWAELQRLEDGKARQCEVDLLVRKHEKLRAEFDALVKSLNVEIKQVPTHHEVKPR